MGDVIQLSLVVVEQRRRLRKVAMDRYREALALLAEATFGEFFDEAFTLPEVKSAALESVTVCDIVPMIRQAMRECVADMEKRAAF